LEYNKTEAVKVYIRQMMSYARIAFSFREREPPAESFLKFRCSLNFPPELPAGKRKK
jgi:hypothetical protein